MQEQMGQLQEALDTSKQILTETVDSYKIDENIDDYYSTIEADLDGQTGEIMEDIENAEKQIETEQQQFLK